jgi:hypothetical protein
MPFWKCEASRKIKTQNKNKKNQSKWRDTAITPTEQVLFT